MNSPRIASRAVIEMPLSIVAVVIHVAIPMLAIAATQRANHADRLRNCPF
jgi:hypothetical protein